MKSSFFAACIAVTTVAVPELEFKSASGACSLAISASGSSIESGCDLVTRGVDVGAEIASLKAEMATVSSSVDQLQQEVTALRTSGLSQDSLKGVLVGTCAISQYGGNDYNSPWQKCGAVSHPFTKATITGWSSANRRASGCGCTCPAGFTKITLSSSSTSTRGHGRDSSWTYSCRRD